MLNMFTCVHLPYQKLLRRSLIVLSSALVLVQFNANAAPSEAETQFIDEVLECASYYQISSETIAGMNAPQMKPVGEKLKTSSVQALSLAQKYQTKDLVEARFAQVEEKQRASLPKGNNLGQLMGKYKDRCKTLLAEPQKRLDYWIMATM